MIKDLSKIFDVIEEHRKVIESAIEEIKTNVADLSTHATNIRKLILTFPIQPASERDSGQIGLEVRTVLARRTTEPTEVVFNEKKHPTLGIAK